jgi:hypothetical protein
MSDDIESKIFELGFGYKNNGGYFKFDTKERFEFIDLGPGARLILHWGKMMMLGELCILLNITPEELLLKMEEEVLENI